MSDEELLKLVKRGMGIYYDDEWTDAALSDMIGGIKDSMKKAGVEDEQITSPLGVLFIVRWCKKLENSDTTIPIFGEDDIAFLGQLR